MKEPSDLRIPCGSRGCDLKVKETVRVTVSDPNPRDKRARWIRDRMSYKNANRLNNLIGNDGTKSDSGFQELSESLPKLLYSDLEMNDNGPFGGSNHYNHHRPHPQYRQDHHRGLTENGSSPDRRLRLGCSLPVSVGTDFFSFSSGDTITPSTRDFIQPDENTTPFLSRQNGIRYSLRRGSPPESISSESEASQQEGCENALNPSPNLLIPNGVGIRKHSVLFSSYDAWNEDNIVQSFREMSSSIGNILEAAWTGQPKELEELLKDEETLVSLKDELIRDKTGRTPLHLSAACGNVPCVQLLIEKGAQVNSYDHQKATPLACAASCGSLPVVEILLAHGADVNAGYDFGKTALHWAIQVGSVDCAKKLLEAGAQQNPIAIFTETPLHVAATLGDAGCLQVLLDHGADSNLCKGPNRSTALHLAADEGNALCLRVLLKSGANHEAKDARGHTALHIAATCDTDSVLTLLKAGANPNATDANGRTPLHCSVSRGSRAAECVRLLVENGAEIDAQDNFGYTPLHLAAVNESSQCASILLSHGADVTSKTKAGTSALTLLVRKIPDVMRFLVDRLDSAVTVHDHDPGDPDCEIRLDFRGIVPNVEKRNPPSKGGSLSQQEQSYFHCPRKETEFLTCLLAAGNKKILAHPLSEAFLTLKWRRVRKFFWASLLFQIALVALYTIFVVEVYLVMCPYKRYPPELEPEYSARNEPLDNTEDIARHIKPTEPPLVVIGGLDIKPPDGEVGTVPAVRTGLKIGDSDPIPNNEANPPHLQDASPKTVYKRGTQKADGFSWINFVPTRRKPPNATNRGRKRPRPAPPAPTAPTTTTTTTTTAPTGFGNRSRSFGIGRRLPGRTDEGIDDETVDVSNNPNGRSFSTNPEERPPTEPPYIPQPTDDVKIEKYPPCEIGVTLTVVWALLVFFASLMAIKEIFQLLQAPFSYIVSSENWGQWALIGSVTLTAWNTPEFHLAYWQYPAAAVGIFLAWGLMLLQVGRFPALGLYVQMLGKVAANFGLFILAYACLLIAFALAFCVLFPEYPAYSSVPLAILKVLTMMVGEVDYEDLFYDEDNSDDPILYPITAHVLHGAFVIIVTIVLMNLLVGLAVHDIQGLQKGAKLNRLSRQTALISRLESFIFSKRLQSCLPRSIGSILQKSALLVPSSYNWSYYFRPNDPRDKRLPKDLKLAALRLAASKHSSRTSRYHPDLRPTNSNNNFAGGSENALRRMEQRLDKIQLQMDFILKNFNEKFDKFLETVDDNAEKKSLSSGKSTQSID